MGRVNGLGKELDRILAEARGGAPASVDRASPQEPFLGPLADEVVQHGLDALCAALPLDLCGYVHVSDGTGPRVALRTPEPGRVDAAQVFDLVTATTPLMARAPIESPIRAGGFVGLAVATAGPRSRGVHVVGRRGHGLSRGHRRMAVMLARAFGGLCHRLEAVDVPAYGGRRTAPRQPRGGGYEGLNPATPPLGAPPPR